LEHVEVMGQEVRGDPGVPLQLARRAIRSGELIDDGEPDRLTEGGVPMGSHTDRVHDPTTY
jgi:hypothetical protein